MKGHLMKRMLALIITIIFLQTPAQAASSTDGGFVLMCPYSHSLKDDPIVFPGQPGATHLHDFFGNKSTNANSTPTTMRSAATLCVEPKDTAGYWSPALYRNGTKIDPQGNGSRTTIYYVNNLSGYSASAIQHMPRNLKMVAGNSHATSVSGNPELGGGGDIYYGCSNNSPDVKASAPINCATGIISLHVGFPNCWDGVHLDSADHQSHMSYPISSSSGYVCPASHPVPIPRVIIRIEYPVGTNSSGITLSSGPTYTAHADFWNTFNQRRLNALTDQCIRTNTECGTDPGH